MRHLVAVVALVLILLGAIHTPVVAAPDVFKDCDTCPEMVVIPAGQFMMGSNVYGDEKPMHRVTIRQHFAVGKYEVTFREWDACIADGGCNGYRPEDRGWGRGRRPVIYVSWNDAKAYVAWLSRKSGKPYRLPSEAEWEYAARAGTTTQYHWGDAFDISKANNGNKMVPVGQYAPNSFGLYDMHGNVLEWVQDCYNESYEGAPTDGRSVSETPDCHRVLRSGAWSYGPRDLRAANRYETPPVDRMNAVGFRVARML